MPHFLDCFFRGSVECPLDEEVLFCHLSKEGLLLSARKGGGRPGRWSRRGYKVGAWTTGTATRNGWGGCGDDNDAEEHQLAGMKECP